MLPPSDRRYRVLLVEDDDADVMLVQRALERFPGFDLRLAPLMQDALDALAAEAIDVALLDLSLPDSFGLEGVQTLVSRFPELPVVVLTGLDDNSLALEALGRGAQDYLAKGQCSPELLVRTLRYAIQRQQIQRENQRLMEELARQARHDSLTGLVNRRSLAAELQREWLHAERTGEPLACALLDIDFFKRINDVQGHAAGDAVLQAIAGLLRSACRGGDLPGRFGGEEFLVILPQTDEEGAILWAERMRRIVADTPIEVAGETLQITASFGVAQRAPAVRSCEQLVDRADHALRLAKQLGRDRVISFAETCELSDTGADGLHDAFSRLTAADIMTPLVASLDQSMNLREATEFLLTLRLDSAPIIDRAGDLVGAVGEEDLAHALVGPDAWNRPVAEVMKKRPSCFATHTPVRVIHDFLSRVAARRVIILEGRRPVGIVSRASILRWREFHELAGRTVLTPLPDEDASPSAIQRSLLLAVAEVRQQAEGLYRGLQTGENSPAEMAVAAATRIQHLLEETVVQSQRLNSRSPAVATISTMVV